MTDTISKLQILADRAAAKVERYAKMLESAKKELDDMRTTMRVMADISGDSTSEETQHKITSVSKRQQEIVDFLRVGRGNGQSPVVLYGTYRGMEMDEINIDTFRTTLWRMKDKEYQCGQEVFIVRSAKGRYWKEAKSPDVETEGSGDLHSDREYDL